MDDPCDPWFSLEKQPPFAFFYQNWLPPIAVVLLLLWAVVSEFLHLYPPVGTYIAIVAVAGVVITIWPPEKPWSKAIWLGIFLFLGVFEIRNLYRDRAYHDNEQAQARAQELNRFNQIASRIDEAIANGQRQLSATVNGFKDTLAATNETVHNTRPKAILEISNLGFQRPMPVTPNRRIRFNLQFTNAGNDLAKQFAYVVHTYVGKANDTDFQKSIVGAFDLNWPVEYRKNFHGSVPAGAKPFISFDSDALTPEDVASLANTSKTLYVVARFSWVDETGRWATDLCVGYQDKLFTSEITHPCIDPKATRVRHTW